MKLGSWEIGRQDYTGVKRWFIEHRSPAGLRGVAISFLLRHPVRAVWWLRGDKP